MTSPGQPSAAAEWLQAVPWQQMATLEFPWSINHKTVLGHFDSYINAVERDVRARVGSVYVMERRSTSGAPVQPHIHALLASPKHLDATDLADMWLDHVGHASNPAYRDLARFDSFDKGGNELLYVCKSLDYPDACWDTRNLNYFLPDGNRSTPTDHQSLRSMRRFQASMK